jgi:hypothetical protein
LNFASAKLPNVSKPRSCVAAQEAKPAIREAIGRAAHKRLDLYAESFLTVGGTNVLDGSRECHWPPDYPGLKLATLAQWWPTDDYGRIDRGH